MFKSVIYRLIGDPRCDLSTNSAKPEYLTSSECQSHESECFTLFNEANDEDD